MMMQGMAHQRALGPHVVADRPRRNLHCILVGDDVPEAVRPQHHDLVPGTEADARDVWLGGDEAPRVLELDVSAEGEESSRRVCGSGGEGAMAHEWGRNGGGEGKAEEDSGEEHWRTIREKAASTKTDPGITVKRGEPCGGRLWLYSLAALTQETARRLDLTRPGRGRGWR